jgi:hypothetical protein
MHPFVATYGNDIILSWTERVAAGHALRYARWDGTGWGTTGTVATGANWFVNWADFPSVVVLDNGTWAAHWLQRSGPGRFAYDVLVATSADGTAWSDPVRPHADATETEHGFVSIFPHAGAGAIVWLDGRHFVDGEHGAATNEMQLRFTTLRHTGRSTETGAEILLDDRICECCQTAAVVTARGPVVFYRDRLPGEIRDISVTRMVDGTWTQPQRVHEDGWSINACPVNGPAADAVGDDIAVAWFTEADATPRVHLAFSTDAGATFGAPIGRVDVLFLDRDRALVVWLERAGEDAEIRGRIIARNGSAGASAPLVATTAGRAGGFPRMAKRGSDVILAWTEPGETSRIRAALLPFGTAGR